MAFSPKDSGDKRPPKGPRSPGAKSGGKPGGKFAEAEPAAPVRKERIAKRLARAGVASRREVERLIGLGRIAVNGRVLDGPAVLVSAQDVVTLDGRPVERPEATRVWRFYKTVGLITAAKDPAGRPTVFDAMPEGMPRVIKIGRLDINSEGLLLLTNDGELARALELPSTGWVRRYRARARGKITQAELDTIKDGVTIEGVRYGPIEATLDKAKDAGGDGRAPANLWITVALSEGKNREVRKVLEHLGVTVNRLIRLSYGPFQLGTLTDGEVAEVGPRVIREQLAAFIHPESLPEGDDVEALPQATGKKRVSALADPSRKPSKVRAHEAKKEALAAQLVERDARRAAYAKEDPRKPPSGDRPRGPYKSREGSGGGDRPRGPYKPREGGGDERPKRAYAPRDGAGGDRPRGPYKPREGGSDRPRGDGPKREFKPRDGAGGGDRPRGPYKPREGGSDRPRGDGPKREFKPRDGAGGGARPRGPHKPREGGSDRPRGDGPKRDFKPREGGGDRPRSGPRPGGKPGGGRPGGGARSGGPSKPRGGGGGGPRS